MRAGELVCAMGDSFPDNGAGEPIYEPCGEKAKHVVWVNGNGTAACRRHALEAVEVADEIVPRLTQEGGRRS